MLSFFKFIFFYSSFLLGNFFLVCCFFSFGGVVFFLCFLFQILELAIFNMLLEIYNSSFGCDFLLTFLLPYSFFHLLHVIILFVLMIYCFLFLYSCLDLVFLESYVVGLYLYLNLLDVSWFFLVFMFTSLVSYYVLDLDGFYFDGSFFMLDSYFSLIFLVFGGFSFIFSICRLLLFSFVISFSSVVVFFLLLGLYFSFSITLLTSSFLFVIGGCLVSSILSLFLIGLGFGFSIRSVKLVFFFKFLGDLFLMVYLVGFFEGGFIFLYIWEVGRFSVNNMFILVPLLIYSVGFPFGIWVSFAMGATSYVSCYLHSCGFIASGVMLYSSLLFYGVFDSVLCYDLMFFSCFLAILFYFFMVLTTTGYKEVFGYFSAISICLFFIISLCNLEIALVYFVVISLIKVIGFSLVDQVKSSVVFRSGGVSLICFSSVCYKVKFYWFKFILFCFFFGFFFMGVISFCLYQNIVFNIFVSMVKEFYIVIFSELFLLLLMVGKGFNLKLFMEDFLGMIIFSGGYVYIYYGFLWILLGGFFSILLCFSFFPWNSFDVVLDFGLIILIVFVFLYFDFLWSFMYDFCGGFFMFSWFLSCKFFILEKLSGLYVVLSSSLVFFSVSLGRIGCKFLMYVKSKSFDFFLYFVKDLFLSDSYFIIKVIFIFVLLCLLFFIF